MKFLKKTTSNLLLEGDCGFLSTFGVLNIKYVLSFVFDSFDSFPLFFRISWASVRRPRSIVKNRCRVV